MPKIRFHSSDLFSKKGSQINQINLIVRFHSSDLFSENRLLINRIKLIVRFKFRRYDNEAHYRNLFRSDSYVKKRDSGCILKYYILNLTNWQCATTTLLELKCLAIISINIQRLTP